MNATRDIGIAQFRQSVCLSVTLQYCQSINQSITSVSGNAHTKEYRK